MSLPNTSQHLVPKPHHEHEPAPAPLVAGPNGPSLRAAMGTMLFSLRCDPQEAEEKIVYVAARSTPPERQTQVEC